ncbi:MAG: hypothetical protein RLZZ210_1724 [Pseudomonadota bacterium]|jgi:2-octaprenyl-6-methoxyphenol hydroxylase
MHNPQNTEQTLVISGAGPVGLFCALKLAQYGVNSVVLDPILSNANPWQNNRTIALSYGSIQLLKGVGVDIASLNSSINNDYVAKIKHVHISIHNIFGACNMHADDYDVDALGYVVSYSNLCHALYNACLASHKICFVAKKLISNNYNSITDLVDGIVEGGAIYSTPLLIVSEGSKMQQQYTNIDNNKDVNNSIKFSNNQYAHVGWLNLPQLPHKYKDSAFERFTNQGPLALLPYPHIDDAGNQYNYAVVWCDFTQDSSNCTMDNLQNIIGWRVGKIGNLKIEQHFNLSPQTRSILHENQTVYIGNSAQSLHPVAGQGLNLGFRQVYALVQSIIKQESLAQFVTNIQNDRLSMLCTTSIMSNIFTLPIPTLKQRLGLILQAIDIIPSLKKSFAQHFMYGRR